MPSHVHSNMACACVGLCVTVLRCCRAGATLLWFTSSMCITNVKLATALAPWRAVLASTTSRWYHLSVLSHALAAKTANQKFYEAPPSSFNINAMMPRGGENIFNFTIPRCMSLFVRVECALGAGRKQQQRAIYNRKFDKIGNLTRKLPNGGRLI